MQLLYLQLLLMLPQTATAGVAERRLQVGPDALQMAWQLVACGSALPPLSLQQGALAGHLLLQHHGLLSHAQQRLWKAQATRQLYLVCFTSKRSHHRLANAAASFVEGEQPWRTRSDSAAVGSAVSVSCCSF